MLQTGILAALLFFWSVQTIAQDNSFKVQFNTIEKNRPIPCNVRIMDQAGNYFIPDSSYSWKTFYGAIYPDYPSNGQFNIRLKPGKYRYEIDRGPEYLLSRGEFEVTNADMVLRPQLKRMVDMKSRNWWSGELHVHRKVEHIQRLMEAGDLHIAPVITSWNEHYEVKPDSVYNGKPKKFSKDRYYTTTGSEDERAGGAILVLNTPAPIDFSRGQQPEYPSLSASVEMVSKKYPDQFWVDIDKPFWWDLPILLATGKVKSIGIAHNHMNRDGIFKGEGWGRARDTARYPDPQGNGFWTQELFYRVLNSGLKITPSAGSASGVLMNPVGYNRMFVHVENKLNYSRWFENARKGKLFVTNGPILICKVNNKYPGEVFRSDSPVELSINTEIFSRDSIDSVQIIRNGRVYKSFTGNINAEKIRFDASGWFLVRVLAKAPGNFRFASTAPYYVEIGNNKTYISRAAAQYFLDWTNERRKGIKADTEEKKAEILTYIDNAVSFWSQKLEAANAE